MRLILRPIGVRQQQVGEGQPGQQPQFDGLTHFVELHQPVKPLPAHRPAMPLLGVVGNDKIEPGRRPFPRNLAQYSSDITGIQVNETRP